MTYDEAKELIREHTDYGGNVDAEGLAEALATPSTENRPAQDDVETKLQVLFIPNPPDEMGPSDDPESSYRLGYNTALEDAIDAIASQSAKEPQP